MPIQKEPQYYIVESQMLPQVFLKVMEAKELIETGEAATVAEAVARVGISRSAFYKYKDSIAPFRDIKRGNMITIHVLLRDRKGVLSSVLTEFALTGANILTINQSIPTNGTAVVTISVETAVAEISTEELMSRIRALDGVIKIEILAG